MTHKRTLAPLGIAALLALAGCIGGGDNDEGPAPLASITLSGTAATGAAIASGAVTVQCATGTASATTAATGAYSVTLTGAQGPCLVRVSAAGAAFYSMLASTSAATATVNVTPLTSLLTAQVLGADPAAAFASFGTAAQARVTAANITTARTDLTAALETRVDLAGVDPIGTTFAIGDTNDQKLVQLAAVLSAASTDLAALQAALLANPGSPDPVRNLVATAAGELCPHLKSGEYWGVEPMDPVGSIRAEDPAVIDAAALTVTFDRGTPGEETFALRPIAGEPCRFSIVDSDGAVTDDLVVSASGILASRFPEGGVFKGSIGLPRTTLAVAELAGSWNYVGYVLEAGAAGITPINGSVDIAADGTLSNNRNFINLTDDTQPEDNTPRRLVQLNNGSFNDRNLTTNETSRTRWIPHRAADGTVTIFVIGINDDNGATKGVGVLRRQLSASVREVGEMFNFWDMTYGANGVGDITAQTVTVTSVNTGVTPNTETRIRTSDSRVDTRAFDSPRTGLLYRAPNSCTTGAGGPAQACPEALFLPTQGTGISFTAGGVPGSGFFNVAVLRP